MRIDSAGNVYICETELFLLLAKVRDPYSGKGFQGAYDGRDGGHSNMILFAESDEDHASNTFAACGVSYVPTPPNTNPDHRPMASKIRQVMDGEL